MARYKTDLSRVGRKIPSAPQASRPVASHSLTFSMALSSSDRQGLIQLWGAEEALRKPRPTGSPQHTHAQPRRGSALKHDVTQFSHISSLPCTQGFWKREEAELDRKSSMMGGCGYSDEAWLWPPTGRRKTGGSERAHHSLWVLSLVLGAARQMFLVLTRPGLQVE